MLLSREAQPLVLRGAVVHELRQRHQPAKTAGGSSRRPPHAGRLHDRRARFGEKGTSRCGDARLALPFGGACKEKGAGMGKQCAWGQDFHKNENHVRGGLQGVQD